METKRKGGAQLGKITNKFDSKHGRERTEIRIYAPSQETIDFIKSESDKRKESRSLVAYELLKEGIKKRRGK